MDVFTRMIGMAEEVCLTEVWAIWGEDVRAFINVCRNTIFS